MSNFSKKLLQGFCEFFGELYEFGNFWWVNFSKKLWQSFCEFLGEEFLKVVDIVRFYEFLGEQFFKENLA